MSHLLGEFECKIDAKGRVMLPTALKKQLPTEAQERFVVNRGFEKCLVLYPYNEWQKISNEINQLNLYNKQNRDFARYFFRGATEIQLDATSRILFPKTLLDYAGVQSDVILFAYANRIEVWSKDTYENLLTDESADFSNLAEMVMGKKTLGEI